jgi:hypothetical protein
MFSGRFIYVCVGRVCPSGKKAIGFNEKERRYAKYLTASREKPLPD